MVHASYYKETNITSQQMEDGISKLLDAWPKEMVAPMPVVDDPIDLFDDMYSMLANGMVKPDASPGFPGMLISKENQGLIGSYGCENLASIAAERLLLLGEISFAQMAKLSAYDLVKLGLTDPIRVFIKNEPHSSSKLAAGRLRIINSVSIIDQLVERQLSSLQNKLEISNYDLVPSMPGMGNHPGEGGAYHTQTLIGQVEDKAGTDAEAYDWTNTHKTLMVDARFRADSQGLDPWENPFTKRQLALSTSLMVLDDGGVYSQVLRGVQKSGSFNTSAGNCRSRTVARAVAFPDKPLVVDGKWQVRVMGDDCVESLTGLTRELLVAKYGEQNLRIKEVSQEEVEGFVEFCGLEFSGKGIHNPRSLKTVVKFLLSWPQGLAWGDRFSDFQDALYFCPKECSYYSDLLLLVKERLGQPILSD